MKFVINIVFTDHYSLFTVISDVSFIIMTSDSSDKSAFRIGFFLKKWKQIRVVRKS